MYMCGISPANKMPFYQPLCYADACIDSPLLVRLLTGFSESCVSSVAGWSELDGGWSDAPSNVSLLAMTWRDSGTSVCSAAGASTGGRGAAVERRGGNGGGMGRGTVAAGAGAVLADPSEPMAPDEDCWNSDCSCKSCCPDNVGLFHNR